MLDELIDKKYNHYTDRGHFEDEKAGTEVAIQMNDIEKTVSQEVYKMFMELESRMTYKTLVEEYNAYEMGVHDGIKLMKEIQEIGEAKC